MSKERSFFRNRKRSKKRKVRQKKRRKKTPSDSLKFLKDLLTSKLIRLNLRLSRSWLVLVSVSLTCLSHQKSSQEVGECVLQLLRSFSVSLRFYYSMSLLITWIWMLLSGLKTILSSYQLLLWLFLTPVIFSIQQLRKLSTSLTRSSIITKVTSITLRELRTKKWSYKCVRKSLKIRK